MRRTLLAFSSKLKTYTSSAMEMHLHSPTPVISSRYKKASGTDRPTALRSTRQLAGADAYQRTSPPSLLFYLQVGSFVGCVAMVVVICRTSVFLVWACVTAVLGCTNAASAAPVERKYDGRSRSGLNPACRHLATCFAKALMMQRTGERAIL